jgi:hypothetical protein
LAIPALQLGMPTPAPGSCGISAPEPIRRSRDLQRTFLLVLATLWLLDAVLQLQPFMFTPGSNGFSGMLRGVADGDPGWIAHTITWNASIVDHHPVLTNTLFALIQFLIAFGIASTRARKPALVLSVVWALAVWWFGEGLGGVFSGGATPFGGGPGGVLFYAVLAILLWPSEGADEPFVAARAVGAPAARVVWVVVWVLMALLSVVGSGRSPQALKDLVAGLNSGEPGWLAHINRFSEALFLHDGTALAILLALVCLVVAIGIFLPPRFTKATLFLAVTVFGLMWVVVQDVGGILAGGATDPNAAPLIILLALIYWPSTTARSTPSATVVGPALVAKGRDES